MTGYKDGIVPQPSKTPKTEPLGSASGDPWPIYMGVGLLTVVVFTVGLPFLALYLLGRFVNYKLQLF